MAADEHVAGPMALWGRRLMGEAISQAQRVAVDRPELVVLMIGEGDLEGFQQMVARMTTAHTQRMRALGLYA
jgi:tRNA-(MS[2]IO[6]A)-hydroxylase (MiaE)-like